MTPGPRPGVPSKRRRRQSGARLHVPSARSVAPLRAATPSVAWPFVGASGDGVAAVVRAMLSSPVPPHRGQSGPNPPLRRLPGLALPGGVLSALARVCVGARCRRHRRSVRRGRWAAGSALVRCRPRPTPPSPLYLGRARTGVEQNAIRHDDDVAGAAPRLVSTGPPAAIAARAPLACRCAHRQRAMRPMPAVTTPAHAQMQARPHRPARVPGRRTWGPLSADVPGLRASCRAPDLRPKPPGRSLASDRERDPPAPPPRKAVPPLQPPAPPSVSGS